MSNKTAYGKFQGLPSTLRALYTRQVILAVFAETRCLDAESLANETLELLPDSCRCSLVLVKFHCSIASIPLHNGTLSTGSLSLSQNVLEVIRLGRETWEWKQEGNDEVELCKVLVSSTKVFSLSMLIRHRMK